MRTLILALAIFFAQSPQTQSGAVIEGFVTRLGSSDPIPRSRLVLTRDGGPPASITATTDGGGKFSFTNVEPGRYRLFASRDGFVRTEWGQRGAGMPGTPITVMAGQEMKDLNIALMPTGAIAGRIYDRYGDPVGNAMVQALKYSWQDGHRTLTVVQSARTNDLGEYRLFWMQPGQYIVSAVPSEKGMDGSMTITLGPGSPVQVPGGAVKETFRIAGGVAAAAGLTSSADTGETYLTVYYPGTTDASSAAPIDLRPGANYTGVDLSVVDTRAVRIIGRVISSRPGPLGASVALTPRGPVVGNMPLQRMARIDDQGNFEFRGIAPGAYDLVAASGRQVFTISNSSTGPNGQTSVTRQAFSFSASSGPVGPLGRGMTANDADEPRLFGRVPLDVGTADIDNVTIQLQPGFRLDGRVSMDDFVSNSEALSNMRVTLRPDPLIPQLVSSPASVSADGTFTISDLVPGDYRLSLVGIPRGGYVQSAVFSGINSADLLLHIDGEPRGALDILVGTRPGSLDATVQDERQQAVAGAIVVLVPNGDRRRRSELYRSSTSDTAGRIHFDGIAPGDYKLFSWDNVEKDAWQDPDFTKIYEERGRSVHISESSHEVAEVRVIRNP